MSEADVKDSRIAEFESFKPKFPLLSRVRDRVSGFTGSVVYVTFSYYHPPVYGVQPRIGENNPEYKAPVQFGEAELVLVANGADSRERFIADGCEVRGGPPPIRPVLIELGVSRAMADSARAAAAIQGQLASDTNTSAAALDSQAPQKDDVNQAPLDRKPDATPAPPAGKRRN